MRVAWVTVLALGTAKSASTEVRDQVFNEILCKIRTVGMLKETYSHSPTDQPRYQPR